MRTKFLVLLAVPALCAAVTARAETQRSRLSTENKFPNLQQTEVGAELRFIEGDDDREERIISDFNRTSVVPYARYGIRENVALEIEVPLVSFDTDFGSDENGLGDIQIGAEVRVFQDIFGAPFVIPHAHVEFDTATEDVLGDGDTTVKLGLTFGQKWGDAWASSHGDHFTWLFDLTYEVRSENENTLLGSAGLIWDISDSFAIVGEVGFSNEDLPGRDHPILYQGGLTYDWSDDLHFAIYGGGFQETQEDVIVIFKSAYTF